MSNIRKILLSEGGGKKNVTKTIRFRESAIQALDKISESSSLSQNEVVNAILDEAGRDLNIIDDIRNYLQTIPHDKSVFIEKMINFKIHYRYIIYKNLSLKIFIEDKDSVDESMTIRDIKLNTVNDLLNYGVDSECKIRYGLCYDEL